MGKEVLVLYFAQVMVHVTFIHRMYCHSHQIAEFPQRLEILENENGHGNVMEHEKGHGIL